MAYLRSVRTIRCDIKRLSIRIGRCTDILAINNGVCFGGECSDACGRCDDPVIGVVGVALAELDLHLRCLRNGNLKHGVEKETIPVCPLCGR